MLPKTGLTAICSKSQFRLARIATNAWHSVPSGFLALFLSFVTLTAITILFPVLIFSFRNLGLGILALASTTMLLFFAHVVLTALDYSFEATWNVDSKPCRDVAMKYRPPWVIRPADKATALCYGSPTGAP